MEQWMVAPERTLRTWDLTEGNTRTSISLKKKSEPKCLYR